MHPRQHPARAFAARTCIAGVLLVPLAAPPVARADEAPTAGAAVGDIAAARAAFTAGREAFERGDAYTAAERFAQADALVPADAALESGLRAALRADAPRLGMELVTRAQERSARGSVAAAAAKAGTAFAARAGRLTVSCDGCRSISIDSAPAADGVTVWLLVGPHLVDAGWSGASARRLVNVVAGTHARVRVQRDDAPDDAAVAARNEVRDDVVAARARTRSAPPASPPAPAGESRTLSPAWFWIGAGATAALGAASVASAVATAEQHAQYQSRPTTQGAAAGKAAQTRTGVLLGFTGTAVLSTAALGLFAVRWGGGSASVGATPGGAAASVRGRF